LLNGGQSAGDGLLLDEVHDSDRQSPDDVRQMHVEASFVW
jgi:hypothetical protein